MAQRSNAKILTGVTNKKLIIAVVSLLLICSVYLSWAELKLADQDADKNWWVLSFENPKNSDLSFVIENHSTARTFHWTVLTAGKTKLKEGDVMIEKGKDETINLNRQDFSVTGKVMIDVTNGMDKKEIYKNF